jgi:hypothetical protein
MASLDKGEVRRRASTYEAELPTLGNAHDPVVLRREGDVVALTQVGRGGGLVDVDQLTEAVRYLKWSWLHEMGESLFVNESYPNRKVEPVPANRRVVAEGDFDFQLPLLNWHDVACLTRREWDVGIEVPADLEEALVDLDDLDRVVNKVWWAGYAATGYKGPFG